MRHSKLVKQWADHNDIRLDTVSFFCSLNGEAPETEFGYCDITGTETELVTCICALKNDTVIEFQASHDLVGGALGRAAGAF